MKRVRIPVTDIRPGHRVEYGQLGHKRMVLGVTAASGFRPCDVSDIATTRVFVAWSDGTSTAYAPTSRVWCVSAD